MLCLRPVYQPLEVESLQPCVQGMRGLERVPERLFAQDAQREKLKRLKGAEIFRLRNYLQSMGLLNHPGTGFFNDGPGRGDLVDQLLERGTVFFDLRKQRIDERISRTLDVALTHGVEKIDCSLRPGEMVVKISNEGIAHGNHHPGP